MIRKVNLENKNPDNPLRMWIRNTIEVNNTLPDRYWLDNFGVVVREYINLTDTYISEKDDEIVGFITIVDGNYIGSMFVNSKYQGQGIGKGLLRHVLDIYGYLVVNVRKSNVKAVNFFKKMEFVIDSEHLIDNGKDTQCSMCYNGHGRFDK